MSTPCKESDEYFSDWQEYRRLRRNTLLVWLGYIPAVGFLAMVGQWLTHTFILGFISAGAYMVWFAMTGAQWTQFSCPRCGEYFGSRGALRLGPLARKCMHCGLPKWQCDGVD